MSDLIDGNEPKLFKPWFRGFTGKIESISPGSYITRGKVEFVNDSTLQITELPVGTWTEKYIEFLDKISVERGKESAKNFVRSIIDNSSDTTVDITIKMNPSILSKWSNKVGKDGIIEIANRLKLTSTISTSNMHMFDKDCKLRKYGSVEQIIDDFYDVRLSTYSKRKKQMIIDLEKLLVKLSNRAKYILATLDGSVDLRKKNAQLVKELMTSKGFNLIDGNFNYLIKMPMDSVTEENVEKILKEKTDAENELNKLKKTTLETMWLSELETLQNEYKKYKVTRENIQKGTSTNNVKKLKKRVTKK